MEKAAGSNEQRPFFILAEYVLDNQLTLVTLQRLGKFLVSTQKPFMKAFNILMLALLSVSCSSVKTNSGEDAIQYKKH